MYIYKITEPRWLSLSDFDQAGQFGRIACQIALKENMAGKKENKATSVHSGGHYVNAGLNLIDDSRGSLTPTTDAGNSGSV